MGLHTRQLYLLSCNQGILSCSMLSGEGPDPLLVIEAARREGWVVIEGPATVAFCPAHADKAGRLRRPFSHQVRSLSNSSTELLAARWAELKKASHAFSGARLFNLTTPEPQRRQGLIAAILAAELDRSELEQVWVTAHPGMTEEQAREKPSQALTGEIMTAEFPPPSAAGSPAGP